MFVVELEFDEDDRRLELRPAHRQRLTAMDETVLAGPWASGTGALLVFDTDRAGVERILADDPYYRAPEVTVRSVRELRPIAGSRSPTRHVR
jgi:uncharacterized protein